MGGTQRRTGVRFDLQLPQLQNLAKRDPISYRDDFLRQYTHFQSLLALFEHTPTEEHTSLAELCLFLAHVRFFF